MANVKDASVFQEMMKSINQYVNLGLQSQKDAHALINNSMNRLQKIKSVLQQRLDDAERKLQNADRALNICEATPKYDNQGHRIPPDCSAQRKARREAGIQEEAAKKNMERMQQILRAADQLITYYQNEEKRFQQLIDEKLPAGHAALRQQNRIVQEYINTHPRQRQTL